MITQTPLCSLVFEQKAVCNMKSYLVRASCLALLLGLHSAWAVPFLVAGEITIDPAENAKSYRISFESSMWVIFHELRWNGGEQNLEGLFADVTRTGPTTWNYRFEEDLTPDEQGQYNVLIHQILETEGQPLLGQVTWSGGGTVEYPSDPANRNIIRISGLLPDVSYSGILAGTDPFTSNLTLGASAHSGTPEMDPSTAGLPFASVLLATLLLAGRRRQAAPIAT